MKKLSYALFYLLVFMCLALLQKMENAEAVFSDLTSAHPNNDAIEYVRQENIVDGYADGTYRPDNMINRAEFTKIIILSVFSTEEIANCLNENELQFSDMNTDQWYSPYICVAQSNEIVSGYPDGSFRPSDNVNFVEAAKIIVEALDLMIDPTESNTLDENWYKTYVYSLSIRSAIPTTIDGFDENISRGEMAEMIYRLKAGIHDQVSLNYYSFIDANYDYSQLLNVFRLIGTEGEHNSVYKIADFLTDAEVQNAPEYKTIYFREDGYMIQHDNNHTLRDGGLQGKWTLNPSQQLLILDFEDNQFEEYEIISMSGDYLTLRKVVTEQVESEFEIWNNHSLQVDKDTFTIIDNYVAYDKDKIYVYMALPNKIEEYTDIDIDSFVYIGEVFYKTNTHVYQYSDREGLILLEEADVNSFEILDRYYAKDNQNIFSLGWFNSIMVIDDVDYESFAILGLGFAKDKYGLFNYGLHVEGFNSNGFYLFDDNGNYLTDGNNLYYRMDNSLEIISGADLDSFEILDIYYAKDNNNIFKLIPFNSILTPEDVDYDSFSSLGWGFARDKYKFFYDGHHVEGFDPDGFRLLDDHGNYLTDGSNVYLRKMDALEIIPDADPDSFEIPTE